MTLEQQAEIKFPMPVKPCVWVKARVLWLRERWIKSQSM